MYVMQGRLGLPATPTRIFTDRRLRPARLILFAAVTVIWDLLNRRNGPFDIDESGYLGIAIADFRAFDSLGLFGWLGQVEAPSFQSPLTTAITTPVFVLFGPSQLAALLVPLAFTLLTIGTTFALARR
jgi:4-amino-4-deoxy-L-arabinose transferase-like glycosyltransferase